MTVEEGEVDTTAISQHGDRAARQDVPDFFDRLADLELRFEQLGKNAEMVSTITAYVQDLRTEATVLRTIRWITLGCASGLAVILVASLGFLIFYRPYQFFFFGGATRVAAITSVIAGVILLTTIVIKGVFRTLSDRHADDPLPPHLQLIVDAAKAATKPGM